MSVHKTHRGLVYTACALSATLAPTVVGQTFSSDPFASPITHDGTIVQTRKVATLPLINGHVVKMNRLESPYDGSGRVFVNGQRGKIFVVTPGAEPALPQATQFLDVANFPGYDDRLTISFEGGLQSFVFHPDYASNGKFYTFHSIRRTTAIAPDFSVRGGTTDAFNIILNEWTDPTPADNIYDGGLPREVLRIGNPGDGHFGGGLAFNRNTQPGDDDYGNLYITLGDAGFPGDRFNTGQDTTAINAAILRIDPLGNNGVNGQYGVPADNPFVGTPGMFDEWYAYGVRNTQHLAFDTGGDQKAWFADIGSGVIEEINVLEPQANYGWSEREGSFEFVSAPGGGNPGVVGLNPASPAFTDPVAEYDHSEGFAITGGYVVRVPGFDLDGRYLFGDLVKGRVFAFDVDPLPAGGQAAIAEVLLTDESGSVVGDFLDLLQTQNPAITRADLRFGTDESGNYYLINKQDNTIRALVIPEPATAALSLLALAATRRR